MSSSRSFLFYCGVLLVVASSVVFGLDWVSAPQQPMHETEATVQAAKLAARIPPPRALTAAVQVRSVYPARPLPPGSETAPNVSALVVPTAPTMQRAPAAADAQSKCDIAACSAAYHSFRAADCSWQPFDGPRRFCDKGQPLPTEAGAAPAAGASIAAPEPAAGDAANPKCNVEACRQAFFTFNPVDCTYQPSNGPRKLCAK